MPAFVQRFVLIRGLAREAGHWHELDRLLLEQFGEATIERVDLPGNGARWRERSPLDIATMAADLRARVWASDRRPPVLIAISLGAMVCLEWLRRWPADPIVGLVAINTSAGKLSAPWERLRVPAWISTARSLLERDPVARELGILELTTSGHRGDRALAERHAAFHRERPIRRTNVVRQMIAAAGFRVDRRSSGAPVLLLNSAGDRMVDPRCSVKLARLLGAPLEVHPTAGHDLSLDDPRWCVERLHAWLSVRSYVTPS
ncbi:MAG TPA: alpha/beta fold hydrolase [Enhygromyxa sp.]|nr:alpha/beta fold hydrolase [Enhygromyxa sp.]